MTSGKPGRWLAPLALIAALGAVGLVVTGSTESDEEPARTRTQEAERQNERADGENERDRPQTTTTGRDRPRTYRVRPGDTLQVISERTGVPIDEIERLNPGIDPQSLTVGERIKLTE